MPEAPRVDARGCLVLPDFLRRAARLWPEREALVEGERRLTFRDWLRAAAGLAHALESAGLPRGGRAAVLCRDPLLTATAIYGVALAGGVFSVLHPETKAGKLAFLLEDLEASVLLTEGALAEVWREATRRLDAPPAVLCREPPAGGGAVPWPDGGADPTTEGLPYGAPPIPTDLAAILYTSGSTGRPKGVVMRHSSMVFAAASIAAYLALDGDRILCALPLSFDYGQYQCHLAALTGSTVVFEQSFAFPSRVLDTIRREGVTVFPGVPTMFAILVALARRGPLALPGIRKVTNTAAALPVAHLEPLQRIFPNAEIFKMYGLTECKRATYLAPEDLPSHPASIGKAIPGTEVLVLDDRGRPVPPGGSGRLFVRGPHLMAGYWRRPEETEAALVPGPTPGERMLATGDLCRIDADGFLYFVGREDDFVKTRGEKVAPKEIEEALLSIDGVREAAVIGVPDEILGQALRAFVVAGEGLDEAAVRRALAERLESYLVPRDIVFVAELPKGPTGKILKQALPRGPSGGGRS